MANPKNDDIDYTAEGATPPRENEDDTARGYDDAAHRGGSYGLPEGEGGVFGTTGGGTYGAGFQVEERPVVGEGDVEK
ncbi:MAG TPA: hypothetical protein VG323_18430 [Thermoanaerobaculia bacterium]|nr:hypothetical protein [Thermoanaerobaculia bacterium]